MADEKKIKAKPKKTADKYARVGFVQATKSVKKEKEMAATLRKIQDGSNRAVCVFTNPDATAETNAVKIDLNGGGTGLTLEANQLGQACTRVGIEKIWYSNIGMGVKILFKANANELAIELKEDWSDEICFKEFTSLRDSETTGTNGDVLFTTVGAAGNDTYTIIISFKKFYG